MSWRRRVKRELDAIQKLRSQAQEQLNIILILQNRISEQDREVSAVLLKVAEAHESLRGRLFERDSYPLWETRELRAFDQSLSSVIYLSAGRGFTGAPSFLRANKGLLLGFGGGVCARAAGGLPLQSLRYRWKKPEC